MVCLAPIVGPHIVVLEKFLWHYLYMDDLSFWIYILPFTWLVGILAQKPADQASWMAIV